MKRKIIELILGTLGMVNFLVGLGGICGAMENGTNFIIPALLFLSSLWLIGKFGGMTDEDEQNCYCGSDESDNRLHFLR